MTKRILTMFTALLFVLAAALYACAPAIEAPSADTPVPAVEVTSAPEFLEIPADAAPSPLPAPAESSGTVYEKLTAMLPVLDSLTRTMGIESETAYSADDADLVWGYLYLMGANFAHTNPLITFDGDTAIVPKNVMEAFAKAGFAALSELPAQTDYIRQGAAYDESAASYRIAPSDMGAAEVVLERWASREDGSVLAVMGLFNVDERMGGLRFTLVPNADANPVYPYSVQNVCSDLGNSLRFSPLSLAYEHEADLDSDGAMDVISFAVDGDDNVTLNIRLAGGKTFTENCSYLYNASAHLGDTIEGDGKTELYLCGDVGSDDYVTNVFRVENGELRKTELYGSVVGLSGDGDVLLSAVTNVLGTYGSVRNYRLDGAAFTFAPSSASAISLYDGEVRALTLEIDGLAAADASGAAVSLPAGTKILLLGTDENSYVRVELADGRQVRLPLRENTDSWGWYLCDVPETDCFTEDLMYAG